MPNTNNTNPRFSSPIRWKGLLPLGIVLGMLFLYFSFFFDTHLRHFLEYIGSRINGAKVDITLLRTSFWDLKFDLKRLQIGRNGHPMKNLFEIERIQFDFLGDALLQKKLVIQNFTVNGVAYNTDRELSNVLPNDEGGAFVLPYVDELTRAIYSSVQSKLKESPLKNLGSLTKGISIDPVINQVGKDLKSAQRVAELENQLQGSTQKWNELTRSLPGPKEAQAVEKRIQTITNQKRSKPQDYLAGIRDLDQVRKDIAAQIKTIQDAKTQIQGEVSQFSKGIGSIDGAIQEDVSDIFAKFKLPRLDFADISPQLFAPTLFQYVEKASRWAALARRYMPAGKKKDGDVTVVQQQRANGIDVHFGVEKTYPSFLLLSGHIDSDLHQDSKQGRVTGKIAGLTNAPPIYGKPTVASLRADFPTTQVRKATATLEVDHTEAPGKEAFQLAVQSFPVENWTFNDTEDLTLAIEKAFGSANLIAHFEGNRIKTEISGKIKNIQYKVSARSRQAESVLRRITSTIPSFDFTARIEGPLDGLKLFVKSNLGTQLAKSLKKEFHHQLQAVQTTIQNHIEGQVSTKRKRLTQQFQSVKTSALTPIDKALNQTNRLTQLVNTQVSRLKSKQTNAATKSLTDKLPKVKLPF